VTELCVDLSNLRELTDGDKELEAELFEEFIESSQKLLATLENSDSPTEWSKAAHALKGISANLGAMTLSEIARTAQEKDGALSSEKLQLLNALKHENAKVIQFLRDA